MGENEVGGMEGMGGDGKNGECEEREGARVEG